MIFGSGDLTTLKIKNKLSLDKDNAVLERAGHKPIFSFDKDSKIIVVSQAPGVKDKESEKAWNSKSGEQLRIWLGVSDEVFYNKKSFSFIPMDFYFPGKGKVGDLPPRKDFAPKWHSQILEQMKNIKLIILIGKHSQDYYIKDNKKNLTETVRGYEEYVAKGFFPIPHPSPLNNIWKKKNPWFQKDIVPVLQKLVKKSLK